MKFTTTAILGAILATGATCTAIEKPTDALPARFKLQLSSTDPALDGKFVTWYPDGFPGGTLNIGPIQSGLVPLILVSDSGRLASELGGCDLQLATDGSSWLACLPLVWSGPFWSPDGFTAAGDSLRFDRGKGPENLWNACTSFGYLEIWWDTPGDNCTPLLGLTVVPV